MEKPSEKIKLYCLPYAGGTAHNFQRFRRHLLPLIEVCPLDPPGHGARMDEPLIPNFVGMAEMLCSQCKDDIERGWYKFAFFGHSMGSILAYLIAQMLNDEKLPMPMHLFLSGSAGPSPSAAFNNVHLLPDDEIVIKLIEMGGIQKASAAAPLFVERFLPILKSDLRAYSEFDAADIKPLSIPMSIFLGLSDSITGKEPVSWDKVTFTGATRFYFEGGHFFFLNNIENIAAIIQNTLIPGKNTNSNLLNR